MKKNHLKSAYKIYRWHLYLVYKFNFMEPTNSHSIHTSDNKQKIRTEVNCSVLGASTTAESGAKI